MKVKTKLLTGAGLLALLLLMIAGPAAAQEGPAAVEQAVLDNLWVLIAGVLVFFMQAGFAMVEGGMVRSKNVGNIMAKNMADAGMGVMAFFCVGYAIAFGTDGNDLFGTDGFFLSSSGTFVPGSSGVGELTTPTFFFFQAAFAAVAATIVSGAMAERTKFSTYLIFSALMTGIIYPVVVHWTWGGGLIAGWTIGDASYSDFAGSTVVHSVGGWAALVGAWMVGPRIGKYDSSGRARAIPGHSIALAVLGVFILWFGWFGFNPGSELAADVFVPHVALNTMLAPCAAMLTALSTIWLVSGKPDVGMAANGTLGGLVAITAGCGTMNNLGAVITGGVAGVVVVASVLYVERTLKVDDPVGAISVHATCGVWGTLAIGLFARYDDAFLGRDDAGLFYGGGLDQLAMQAVLVVAVAAWVVVASLIVFGILKATIGLRVSEEEETAGLDISEHGSPGYGESVAVLPAGG